jgi:hypothetical protein
MSKPINLNKFRKQKTRADQRIEADANAIRFGRSKAERASVEANAAKARSLWDGHHIEISPSENSREDGA